MRPRSAAGGAGRRGALWPARLRGLWRHHRIQDGRGRMKRWSQRVTERSNALDLDPGVFVRTDPRSIARSLKRSADRSRRRKSDPYRSAMSMLTFYLNRAGKTLSKTQRARLEAAKDELRKLYHRPPRPLGKPR
ncbi:MAG: DUF3175 domain-containing protein [Gemmatimonadales bacterium]